jgi:hypothetical protein
MFFIIILLFSFTEQAYSFYLDPGTGSYLSQIIIATALSAMFYFKNIKGIIKNIIQEHKLKK